MPEPDAGRRSFEEFTAGALPALLRFGHVLTSSPQEAEDRYVLFSQPDIIIRHVRQSEPSGKISGPGIPGIVLGQFPAPGARVAVNGQVTLGVSSTSGPGGEG